MKFPSKKDILKNTLATILLAMYVLIGIAILWIFVKPTTTAAIGLVLIGGILYSLT